MRYKCCKLNPWTVSCKNSLVGIKLDCTSGFSGLERLIQKKRGLLVNRLGAGLRKTWWCSHGKMGSAVALSYGTVLGLPKRQSGGRHPPPQSRVRVPSGMDHYRGLLWRACSQRRCSPACLAQQPTKRMRSNSNSDRACLV